MFNKTTESDCKLGIQFYTDGDIAFAAVNHNEVVTTAELRDNEVVEREIGHPAMLFVCGTDSDGQYGETAYLTFTHDELVKEGFKRIPTQIMQRDCARLYARAHLAWREHATA